MTTQSKSIEDIGERILDSASFEIRAVKDDERIVEGIATTDDQALDDMVLETDGIEYSLPIPFLLDHDPRQPLGNVVAAERGKGKIFVRIKIAPAGVDDFVDKTWARIKSGLIRRMSIRWKTLKSKFDPSINGLRVLKSKWIELSACSVGIDQNAVMTSVRAIDANPAAIGTKESTSTVRISTNPAGASAQLKRQSMKTIPEKIAALEAKRAANTARIAEISEKAVGEESRTFEDGEKEEIANLRNEVTSIDDTLVILRDVERDNVSRAVAVTEETTATTEKSVETRQGRSVVQVKSMAPKGIGVARQAIAMINARGNPHYAAELSRKHWPDSPEVELSLRAVIEAGDTTTSGWASQLVPAAQQMNEEFLELLRPATIIGRIPGLRRVPFNIAVPVETASGTAQWVGEAAPKPVTKLTLSSVTLTWAKAAAIVVITKELAKFSRPDAEMVVRDSMVKTLVRFFDSHFVSATAAVSNVSPAGILNGISATTPSGSTAAAFRTDLNNMLNNFTANNVPLSGIVLLMSSTSAVALSLMVTDLGVPLFPSITREGGSILGFPVVISEAVGTKIIALNANDILLASDPGVQVDVSDTASVEMSDTPIVGDASPITGATLKSFWQNNLIGIRVEQFITWKRGRDSAVEYLSPTTYAP